jgi:hypothetical protein
MSAIPYTVKTFGEEGEPVVIIEDFAPDPGVLMTDAMGRAFAPNGPHYPGIRSVAPAGYLQPRQDLLREVLVDVFGFDAGTGAQLLECNYSLVTTRPDELTPIQRLPHFDGLEPDRIALLHYMSGPQKGGTAFYRHIGTGFETITAERHAEYDAALRAEIAEDGEPGPGYFTGSNTRFEQIGEVEAGINRAILYRGRRLHSGIIPADFDFEPSAAKGRLTVNSFLAMRR